MKKDEYLFYSRKRWTLFGLPWTFTKYKLTNEKFVIENGIFNIKQEEIRLYRIMDITLHRNFMQRIFGLGTIHCCSGDKTTPEFDIINIKNSESVKDILSDLVEKQRDEKKVTSREFMDDQEY